MRSSGNLSTGSLSQTDVQQWHHTENKHLRVPSHVVMGQCGRRERAQALQSRSSGFESCLSGGRLFNVCRHLLMEKLLFCSTFYVPSLFAPLPLLLLFQDQGISLVLPSALQAYWCWWKIMTPSIPSPLLCSFEVLHSSTAHCHQAVLLWSEF